MLLEICWIWPGQYSTWNDKKLQVRRKQVLLISSNRFYTDSLCIFLARKASVLLDKGRTKSNFEQYVKLVKRPTEVLTISTTRYPTNHFCLVSWKVSTRFVRWWPDKNEDWQLTKAKTICLPTRGLWWDIITYMCLLNYPQGLPLKISQDLHPNIRLS